MMILSARPSQVKLQGSITMHNGHIASLRLQFTEQCGGQPVSQQKWSTSGCQCWPGQTGVSTIQYSDGVTRAQVGHGPNHCLEDPGWLCGQKGIRLEGSQADWPLVACKKRVPELTLCSTRRNVKSLQVSSTPQKLRKQSHPMRRETLKDDMA